MERYLQWAVDNQKLTPGAADLIRKFLTDRIIDRGVSNATAANRAKYLGLFLQVLPKPVQECSTDDVRGTLAAMRSRYKPNTFGQMLYTSTTFLEWLKIPAIDIPVLKKIKAPPADRTTKTAAEMLSEEDVQRLIKATRNSRDRALVTVMYESGCRPIEMVRLSWDEVKFDEWGAVINTAEKTGTPRYIRLIMSSPALAAWKADYPGQISKGARVFVKHRGNPPRPITTTTIRRLLEKLVRQAGLKKRMYPYLVRHSRVTHMMEQQIPESVIKLQHWGSLRTDMLATYAHVSNSHVDQVLLERAGVSEKKKRRDSLLKPVQCPQCQTINLPGAEFCGRCGLSFSEEGIAAVNVVRNLMSNPDDLIAYAEYRKRQKEKISQ